MNSFKEITKDKTPIVITSHPRSGTHLTIDLIRRHFPETIIKKRWGKNLSPYLSIEGFLEKDEAKRLSEKEALKKIIPCPHPIVKLHTHSWQALKKKVPHWMQWINDNGKIIYVARDVRSVMPSMHLYQQSFLPKARCPIKDYLHQPCCGRENRIAYWNEQMLEWYGAPGHLSIRFEDIIKNTENAIEEIGNYCSLKPHIKYPLLPPRKNSIWQARFQRIFSSNPKSTAIVGYYKGQKTKKWQELFDADDLEFIYTYGGEAMKKLGYSTHYNQYEKKI